MKDDTETLNRNLGKIIFHNKITSLYHDMVYNNLAKTILVSLRILAMQTAKLATSRHFGP